VRVHEGLPPRPLPMQAPAALAPPAPQAGNGQGGKQGQSGGTTGGQPETQTAIEQLFRDLFGGGRN